VLIWKRISAKHLANVILKREPPPFGMLDIEY